jgi:hypothetical protein
MHFMAETSNMFLVAVEQAFCSTKLANSDRTNILGPTTHNTWHAKGEQIM